MRDLGKALEFMIYFHEWESGAVDGKGSICKNGIEQA